MMFAIITSLIGIVLSYAKARDDKAMVLAVEGIRADIQQNQIKADIIKAQLGHRVAWLPRTIIEFAAAFYFLGWIVDAVFDLPGEMQELPPSAAALLGAVYSGMFLGSVLRR
jgi:hypothetical protein